MGNGEIRKFYYVQFNEKKDHELPNKRVIKIDVAKFYVSKGKDTLRVHEAAHLSRELAEQIVLRYPERNPTIKDDSEYDYGDTPELKYGLWEVGETAPPPPPVPTGVAAFEDAIRTALAQLGRAEVWSIFGRIYS